MRRVLLLISLVASLALLTFAVLQPALTIEAKIAKSELANTAVEAITEDGQSQSRQMLYSLSQMLGLDKLEGHIDAYGKTRSIWGTVVELYEHDNRLVAILVALFSVVVPLCKSLMQFIVLAAPRASVSAVLLGLSGAMSKWSMADVFVVALFLGYFSFINMDAEGVETQTEALFGLYCFGVYVILSLLATQFMQVALKKEKDKEDE